MGTFGPEQVITTAADGALSVFAADLDSDGDIDVLSASANDNKIAWYQNTDGLGAFSPQRIVSAGLSVAISVFAADLDADGDVDVLSASVFDNKIAWYENTDGLGTFGPQRVITASANRASFVFATDLDGDADIDVLSASEFDDKIAWYVNETDCNGNGINDGCEHIGVDCNNNNWLDVCDSTTGGSADCNANGVPDECEPNEDCNSNGVQDICDVGSGTSGNCNFDLVPDECQPDVDCDGNGTRDLCDIGAGAEP